MVELVVAIVISIYEITSFIHKLFGKILLFKIFTYPLFVFHMLLIFCSKINENGSFSALENRLFDVSVFYRNWIIGAIHKLRRQDFANF